MSRVRLNHRLRGKLAGRVVSQLLNRPSPVEADATTATEIEEAAPTFPAASDPAVTRSLSPSGSTAPAKQAAEEAGSGSRQPVAHLERLLKEFRVAQNNQGLALEAMVHTLQKATRDCDLVDGLMDVPGSAGASQTVGSDNDDSGDETIDGEANPPRLPVSGPSQGADGEPAAGMQLSSPAESGADNVTSNRWAEASVLQDEAASPSLSLRLPSGDDQHVDGETSQGDRSSPLNIASEDKKSLDGTTDSDPEDAVSGLWEQFKGTILGRVALIEQAATALLEDALGDDLRREAEREAHKLTGSFGMFGFHKETDLARELERTLGADTDLGQEHALGLSQAIVALRQGLQVSAAGEMPHVGQDMMPAAVAGDSAPVIVVDRDIEFAERLVLGGAARGMRTELARDLAAARTAISRERPRAVLIDLALDDPAGDGTSMLSELSTGEYAVPALALADEDTFDNRLNVARIGGRGFLVRSQPPAQILDSITRLLERPQRVGCKILAVDDDPTVLVLLRTILETHGFVVTTLNDAHQFWETLNETLPDLVVLDVGLPDVSGLDLCQVLRNEPRWSRLPVLFLTSRIDTQILRKVFSVGADDYVRKPIVEPELLVRIASRLERAQLLESMDETDALTGLASSRKAIREIEHFLRLAQRNGQPVSLSILGVDWLKDIRHQSGQGAVDRIVQRVGGHLRGIARGEDDEVIGRGDSNRYIIGMYGMSRNEGVRRMAQIIQALDGKDFGESEDREARPTFSAGVAEYPIDGSSVRSLRQAAEEALEQALATGGGQALPVGWDPDKTQTIETVDVLLVDDDEAVAGIVLHALSSRGYNTRWLQDGQEAADALGGQDPSLTARVVILDIGLPGLDGLGLLRLLHREDALRRTRVIMLTARSSESDVLGSLEIGAFDHVAKPFSVSVLVHKVRRALED